MGDREREKKKKEKAKRGQKEERQNRATAEEKEEDGINNMNKCIILFVGVSALIKYFHDVLPWLVESPVQHLRCAVIREMFVADNFEVQEINIWQAVRVR